MSTVNVATSYITDKVYVNKIGGMITEEEKIGFTGTKTVAKLKGGRTYNFATKVENAESGYQYKAVFITKGNGNILSREFVADGKEQSFSITLGEDEHTIYINNSEGVKVVVSYEQEADFDPKPADFKTPQPFRFWCQTVLPLVYDDSLSYYELLSKVVNYLNSLINDVTNVENIYVNLTNAYTELEAYVNTYFDNLDVSEAIDAKLDAMVLAGDFDALVAEALSQINYSAIINARVDEDLPDVVDAKLGTVVENQIGTVVENQIGGVVENQIGGVVASQIGDVVEEKLGDEVSAQLPDEVETLIGPAVALQIGDAVGDKIGNEVRSQIDDVVANQIDGVVEEQIGDVVTENIEQPVVNWLASNFDEPPVDKSLTIDNAAGDAKVVGDFLNYFKNVKIEGFTRKESDLTSGVHAISTSYISKHDLLPNTWRIRLNQNSYNCVFITGLIGGASYIVDMIATDSTLVQNGAGWLCRDLHMDGGLLVGTEIDTIEHYTGYSTIGGKFKINIPYNCNSIILNSLNTKIIDVNLQTTEFEGNILPPVAQVDDGKVMGVVNGEWDKIALPNGNLPPVTSADNGAFLRVVDGGWDVEGIEDITTVVNAKIDANKDLVKTSVFSDGYGDFTLTASDFDYGAIDTSTGADSGTNASRIRTNVYIPSYSRKIEIYLKSSDYTGFVYHYTNNDGTGYIGRTALAYGTNYASEGGYYRVQLAKSGGTNFDDADKADASEKLIIRNYAIFMTNFAPSNFSVTYKNVNNFIASTDYDSTDYSYTQVTDYITSANPLNDKSLPAIIIFPTKANVVKKQVIVSLSNSATPSAVAPCNIYDFPASANEAEIFNLIPKKTYYYWIKYTYSNGDFATVENGTFKTTDGSTVRMITAKNIQNVRDIGGWTGTGSAKVKYDKIFRGSSLDEDVGKNLAIFDSGKEVLTRYLNVGTDIDLRTGTTESALGYGITFVSAPISNYATLINTPDADVKTIIEAMITAFANNKAVYIHCQGGCDRTGSIITLILGLLGVSESDLAKEYELSCFSKIGGGRYRSSNSYDYKGMMTAIKSLAGTTLQEKIEGYFVSCGLTSGQLTTFKSYLI